MSDKVFVSAWQTIQGIVDSLLQQSDVVRIRASNRQTQQNAVRVSHQRPLFPLFGLVGRVFSVFSPPNGDLVTAPSTHCHRKYKPIRLCE